MLLLLRCSDLSLPNSQLNQFHYPQIYQAYTGRGSANQEGLPLQSALQILRTKGVNLQPHELLNHVRQLCDDGRLYSTIDDEHHKPTSEDF